jgi:hypothetical protein
MLDEKSSKSSVAHNAVTEEHSHALLMGEGGPAFSQKRSAARTTTRRLSRQSAVQMRDKSKEGRTARLRTVASAL